MRLNLGNSEMSTNESLACHLTILSIIHSFMQSRTLILGNWFLNLRVTEGSLPTRLKSVMWLETRVWLAQFVLEWWSLELCGERCDNTLLQLDYTKLFFSRTLFSWYHLLAHDCMYINLIYFVLLLMQVPRLHLELIFGSWMERGEQEFLINGFILDGLSLNWQ